LAVHRRRQLRRRLDASHQRNETGHIALVQTFEQQPAVALSTGQIRQGRQQRMPPVHLGVPVDAHHQQPGTLQLPAHKPQQSQRGRIRPVQVVQHQQQRPPHCGRPQEPGQAVE
jgi:hypothetical protein